MEDPIPTRNHASLALSRLTPHDVRRWLQIWAALYDRVQCSSFPTKTFGPGDYVIGLGLISICFVFFFHDDMWGVGWDSLNYLYGDPLDFYENCKKIRGGGQNMAGTPYPPSIYVIFALWLYPLKLLGWIQSAQTFPVYLTYWLKLLTTGTYAASASIFYRISLEYVRNKEWAKYATAVWLTMPLALFSQFVFSQYDVFYTLLTLAGFLMFLRGGLKRASLYFGLAITFKYFPAFVFFPLLLLFEKRLTRIASCSLLFILPTLIVNALYGHSPAFIEGVLQHSAIERIFAATSDIGLSGFWHAYLLPMLTCIACGIAFFTRTTEQDRAITAGFVWLVTSIVPFLLFFWHPQWTIFFAAPIALTSMLDHDFKKWLLLDIAGMFLFVATVSLTFIDNIDAAMLQGQLIGLDFHNGYLMADIFEWFGSHSLNVFYSGFLAYLVLQIVLKYKLLSGRALTVSGSDSIDYGPIRQRFYVGLLTFLLPASFAIYKDASGDMSSITNFVIGQNYGPLFGLRTFEQSFVAVGSGLDRVGVFLEKSSGLTSTTIHLEIVDERGRTLAEANEKLPGMIETAWHNFTLKPVLLSRNSSYIIRLTSPKSASGSGITWIASSRDSYKDGEAIVDGVRKDSDFSFRIRFVKKPRNP